MKRKIIIVLVTAAIFALAMLISNLMADSKKTPPKKKVEHTATVFSEVVKNQDVLVEIEATGKLLSKDRVELFAEVQGVMQATQKAFKTGTAYKKGQLLININAAVFEASLISQKSNLQNLVTGVLADIRLDFPASFAQWEQFAKSLDVNKPLVALPKPINEQEKMFISGRNIYVTYYNVKNSELTLEKYKLQAPFNGVLIDASVTEGSLVRPGQKLGTFIKADAFELETPVSSSLVRFLKIGQEVDLTSTLGDDQMWKGKIVRINNAVNTETQMVSVFIQVSGKHLAEGLFLKAKIDANTIENAFEIPRSVLFDDNQVYVADKELLIQKTVEVLHYKEKTVVVRGLKDGEKVLVKTVPNAYPGMKIRLYKDA
jgi:multidrug efflux pump subunit AcrA (membrane-fusion protein)